MATLSDRGREFLDQTPLEIPFKVSLPEPIHIRMRRIAEQMYREKISDGEDVETLEEANDFDVPDEPAEYKTPYEEPDYMPPVSKVEARPYSDEEIAAARALINKMREQKEHAGSSGVVSSTPGGPAEQTKSAKAAG